MNKEIKKQAYLKLFENEKLLENMCYMLYANKFTKEEIEIINHILEKYGENVELKDMKTYDSLGCDNCHGTGFYDRIGIFEILNVTDELKELIVSGSSSMEIRKKALEGNYRPLIVDGIKKVLKGETTLEELNKKLLFF